MELSNQKKLLLLAKVVFLVTLIFSVLASPILNVTATSVSNNKSTQFYSQSETKSSFTKLSNLASKSKMISNSDTINLLKEKAISDINDKKITIYNQGNLDFNSSKGMVISEQNKIYKSLTIPILGGQYSTINNVTIVYGEDNNVVTYSETLITESSNQKFIINTYADGSLIDTKNTDINFISNSEIRSGLTGLKDETQTINNSNRLRGVGKIAACIAAVTGVNATVAYLIAGTCIASCPAIPPICAACIGGVCAMGAADIGAVIGCFKL